MEYVLRHLQYTKLPYEFNSTMNSDYDDSDFSDRFASYDNPTTNNKGSGRDAYEFVAFLLWYLFLVLFCVIPTCCAYRRRRLVEARIAQQQASVSRIERQNLFILSSLRHSQHNTERIREQRGTKIAEKLKETTMTVQEHNIVDAPEEASVLRSNVVRVVDEPTNTDTDTDINDNTNNNSTAEETPQSVAVEYDIEAPDPESTHCLQILTQKATDTSEAIHRTVPGGCAICLCPYEEGDEVTWSPRESCQHAFHSECIIPWLAKSDEPKCPCCRQDFCDPVPSSQLDMDHPGGAAHAHAHPFNFFGPSLAHLIDDGDEDIVIPHFMRTIEASRLEFLASLELVAVDPSVSNNRSAANNDNSVVEATTNLGEGGMAGGSPFEIASGSPFEVTSEAQENETSNSSNLPSEEERQQPVASNDSATEAPGVPLSELTEQTA